MRHGVQWVGHDDENAVGRILYHLADNRLHDVVIRVEQVVAAHAGLARDAGRDDDNIRIGSVFVVVGAADVGIALLDRHGLEQIEPLALRYAFDDVDQDYIGEFFGSDPVGGRRAYVA